MQALEGQEDKQINIRVNRNKQLLIIEVTDNGPGIPTEMQEDIFVPFFTTKSSGTGIGLSLSRQIIQMHGGNLSVQSIPYTETCFRIVLPTKSYS